MWFVCLSCQHSVNNNGTSKSCDIYLKKTLGINRRCVSTKPPNISYKLYKPINLKRLLYHIGNRKEFGQKQTLMLLEIKKMYDFWKGKEKNRKEEL